MFLCTNNQSIYVIRNFVPTWYSLESIVRSLTWDLTPDIHAKLSYTAVILLSWPPSPVFFIFCMNFEEIERIVSFAAWKWWDLQHDVAPTVTRNMKIYRVHTTSPTLTCCVSVLQYYEIKRVWLWLKGSFLSMFDEILALVAKYSESYISQPQMNRNSHLTTSHDDLSWFTHTINI